MHVWRSRFRGRPPGHPFARSVSGAQTLAGTTGVHGAAGPAPPLTADRCGPWPGRRSHGGGVRGWDEAPRCRESCFPRRPGRPTAGDSTAQKGQGVSGVRGSIRGTQRPRGPVWPAHVRGGRGERKVGSGAGCPPEPFRRGSDSGRLPKGRRQKGVSSVRTVQGAGECVGQGQARGCPVCALCEGDRPGERIPQHERRRWAGAESRGASALETEPRPQRGAHPATWTVPDRRGCRAFPIPQARGPSPGCGGSGVLGRR